VVRAVAVIALGALVLAGCGVRTSKPYTAAGTAPCLKKQGFAAVTTSPKSLVASIAANGGIEARSPSRNQLTIAFAADEKSVSEPQAEFRRFAHGLYKRHLADVMRTVKNAVMVWTITPSDDEQDTASRCLQP
jgi:hypothetical protein